MQNFLSGGASEKPKPPPQTQPVAPQVASTSTVHSLIGPTPTAPSTVVDTTAAAALADCAEGGAAPSSQDDAAAQQLLLPLKPVMPESQGHAATAAESTPTAETAPTSAAPTPPATAECDVISTKMQDVAAVENNAD